MDPLTALTWYGIASCAAQMVGLGATMLRPRSYAAMRWAQYGTLAATLWALTFLYVLIALT